MSLDPAFFSGVGPYGSPDYYALLFSREAQREDMRILLALENLLTQLSRQPAEAAVRQARLAWWAAELDRLSRGEPLHPVAVAAQEILSKKNQSPAPVLALFAALVREASEDFPGTPDELLAHAGQRGAMVPLIADMLIAKGPLTGATLSAFEQLGRARFVAMELGAGHVHPTARHHANETAAVLKELAVQQNKAMDASMAGIPEHDRTNFTPLLVMAGQLRTRLDAMAGESRPRHSSNLSRLLRAWRNARRASHGKLPT